MSTSPVLGTDPSKWPYPYNPAQGGLGLSLDSQQSLTNNQKDQGRANLDIWGKGSYQLCCDFNFNPSYAWQAGITSISVRQFHKAYRYLAGVRLTFVNFSAASGSNIETPTGNDVTHSGYLEYNGILYPIVFNEGVAASLTIPSGFMGHGFVNVDIPPGDQFSTRVYTTVPSTSSYIPTPCTLQATDSYTSGSDVTNATGAMATQAIGSNYPGPALITSAFSPGPSVIGFGDSIFQGSGDIRALPGYFNRSVDGKLPWLNLSRAGTKISDWLPSVTKRRSEWYKYAKYAITQPGTNDLNVGGRTLATMQANALALWNSLAARGVKVYACTLTPVTTSNDGYTSVSGQSVKPTETTLRGPFNSWLRTIPAPLAGIMDVAALVEVDASGVLTLNGGRWKIQASSPSVSGAVTASGANTLTASAQSWTTAQWVGYMVRIVGGTGAGQAPLIIKANTVTALTVGSNWAVQPDTTSTFEIWKNTTVDGLHPGTHTVDDIVAQRGINTDVFV